MQNHITHSSNLKWAPAKGENYFLNRRTASLGFPAKSVDLLSHLTGPLFTIRQVPLKVVALVRYRRSLQGASVECKISSFGNAMDQNPYSAQHEAAVAAFAAAEVGLQEQYKLYGHLYHFDEHQAKLALKNAEVKFEALERELSALNSFQLSRTSIHYSVYGMNSSWLGHKFDALTGRVPKPPEMSEAEKTKLAE